MTKKQKTIEEKVEEAILIWSVGIEPDGVKSLTRKITILVSDIIRELIGEDSEFVGWNLHTDHEVATSGYDEGYKDGFKQALNGIRHKCRKLGIEI